MQNSGNRPGAALMGARFEVDVQCSAASSVAGLVQGDHLGVLDSVISVEAFANDPTFRIDDDGVHLFLDRLPVGGFTGYVRLTTERAPPPLPQPQPQRPAPAVDEEEADEFEG